MTLANHVATLGRGPGRSRSLTRDEAADAMSSMLSGGASPEAVGALLMLMRMKGETAEEIAGFAEAALSVLPELPRADLDWPAYAAGRTRGLPWFLLSARIVSMAGYRVLLHGWNGSDTAVRTHLGPAGIAQAATAPEAATALSAAGLAYMPLEALHPRLFGLLSLRSVLGLRSCINTVCRMLNPARAGASVQGVFHPSYRLLQADTAAHLGWSSLTVIKGGGGEFERHPGKVITAFGLRAGMPFEAAFPPRLNDTRRLSETPPEASLEALWSGLCDDTFATGIVVGTAALALHTLGHDAPDETAWRLWSARHKARAA